MPAWTFKALDADRVGVVEGTTISGAESIIKARDSFAANDGNFRALHPYNVVAGYCGEGSSTISLHLGIRGHAVTYCSGCASGNDAIGYAAHMIQDRRCRCGGRWRRGRNDGDVARRLLPCCAP